MDEPFDRVARMIGQSPQILHAHARAIVVELQAAGIRQARQNLTASRAIDTRATYDGINASVPEETETGWTGAVVSLAPQGIFVERGRRANRRMPPGRALLGWMERHGIPLQREFVIRRAIGRRGIPARPFIAPLPAQLDAERLRLMREVGERIRVTLSTTVAS